MSINSNVTDSNTNTLSIDNLQIANNNEDAEPSALMSVGNLVKTKLSWIFGGGEEDKQIKQDDEEDTPQQPSTIDASMPTNTSITSSFTSTANLNNEEEKNDAPQDDLVSAPNNIPITSVQLCQNNDDSRSIKICKERQVVTKFKKQQAEKDKQQRSTSMNQLTTHSGTGLSLEGDVKNNSNADSNLDETTVAKSTGGKSIFSVCREKNAEMLNASNNTPARVSDPSKEETSELGGGNNNGTLVLYSGSNNNMNDSVNSSLGDGESFSLSVGGDTIVNTDSNFQATESSGDLQLELKALTLQFETAVAEKESLEVKVEDLLDEKERNQKIFLARLADLREQRTNAIKSGDKKLFAIIEAEIKAHKEEFALIREQANKVLDELKQAQVINQRSHEHTQRMIFQLERLLEKFHQETIGNQHLMIKQSNYMINKIDRLEEKLLAKEEKEDKKKKGVSGRR